MKNKEVLTDSFFQFPWLCCGKFKQGRVKDEEKCGKAKIGLKKKGRARNNNEERN